MPGAMRAIENVGDTGNTHLHGMVGTERIHGVDRWQPRQVATRSVEAGKIRVRRARVLRIVFIRTELGRVDEHTGDHTISE